MHLVSLVAVQHGVINLLLPLEVKTYRLSVLRGVPPSSLVTGNKLLIRLRSLTCFLFLELQ